MRLVQRERWLATFASSSIVASAGAGVLTLNGRTYDRTTSTYASSADWSAAVESEFGTGALVADFTTLKADALATTDGVSALFDWLGSGTSAHVLRNGSKNYPSSSYTYFAQAFATDPGPGWFVIDSIGAAYPRTNLGRWTGTRVILADVTNAVPGPGAFALLGAAGLMTRRRKA